MLSLPSSTSPGGFWGLETTYGSESYVPVPCPFLLYSPVPVVLLTWLHPCTGTEQLYNPEKLWSYSQSFTFDIEKANLQTMSCKFEDCRCWWAKLCVAHSRQGASKKIPKIHSCCTQAGLFEWETQTLPRSISQCFPSITGAWKITHIDFSCLGTDSKGPKALPIPIFCSAGGCNTLYHCSIALPSVLLYIPNPRPVHSNSFSFSRLNPAFGDHHRYVL